MVKRCHWSFTEGPTGTTCPIVGRIPKVHKTGDTEADNNAEMRRSAFIFVCETLWDKPELIIQAQSWLVQKSQNKGRLTAPNEFTEISTLGKIDVAWLVGWLVKVLGWPKDILEKALDYDADAVRHILQFLLVACPTLKLPPAMINKAVAMRVLEERLKQCGDRQKMIKKYDNFVESCGRLKWEVGAYQFRWGEANKAIAVKHLPTKVEIPLPEEVVVTQAFEMRANFSDFSATAFKGASRFVLAELFPDGSGPKALQFWSGRKCRHIEDLADTIAAEVADAARRSNNQISEEAVKSTAAVERQAKAATRAREALERRKAEVDTKRRISLVQVT